MAVREVSSEEWADYLNLYSKLCARLARETWFQADWETQYGYMNAAHPRGVFMQLGKPGWLDGSIHFETWLNNSALERGIATIALHIEPSNSGIPRARLARMFVEQAIPLAKRRSGLELRPGIPSEPLIKQVAFTPDTLVRVLTAEFRKLEKLGPILDDLIEELSPR
jgi:hypothetical protein